MCWWAAFQRRTEISWNCSVPQPEVILEMHTDLRWLIYLLVYLSVLLFFGIFRGHEVPFLYWSCLITALLSHFNAVSHMLPMRWKLQLNCRSGTLRSLYDLIQFQFRGLWCRSENDYSCISVPFHFCTSHESLSIEQFKKKVMNEWMN